MIRKALCALAAFAALGLAAAPAAATNLLLDSSYETQGATTSNYCYLGTDCQAGVWSGTGSGFQDQSNTAWPGLTAPDGSKYAFVQNTGNLDQMFTALTSGMYNVAAMVAGRPPGCCAGNQSVNFLIDNVIVGTVATVTGQPFMGISTSDFYLTAGAHAFSIQGLSTGGDNTMFLDRVAVNSVGGAVPEPATWAMMIMGFGVIGVSLRSRRRQTALA